MSGIKEIIAETQAEEAQAKRADSLMVHVMFGILAGRLTFGNMPEWEQKQLRQNAEQFANEGSRYAKRILEILEGK